MFCDSLFISDGDQRVTEDVVIRCLRFKISMVFLDNANDFRNFATLYFTALRSQIKSVIIQFHKKNFILQSGERLINKQNTGFNATVRVENTGRQ